MMTQRIKRYPAVAWACVVLAVVVCMTAYAGVRTYFGPDQAQCLTVTGDSAISGFTVTGSGTHFGALDGEQEADCLLVTDGAATMVQCAASTNCQSDFTLADTSGLTGKTIHYVVGTLDCRRDSGTAKGGPNLQAFIGGTPYTLVTSNCTVTGTFNTNIGASQYTNPATGLRWTVADIDGMLLRLDNPSATSPRSISGVGIAVAFEDKPENFTTTRERQAGGN